MTEIKFDSSEQMWNTLNEKAIDLYALPDKEHELGIYIALCNDFGTLYYYECDLETAKELSRLCSEEEYWENHIKHIERLYSSEDKDGNGNGATERFIEENFNKRTWVIADKDFWKGFYNDRQI